MRNWTLMIAMSAQVLAQGPACPEKSVLATIPVELRPSQALQPADFLLSGKGVTGGVLEVKDNAPIDLVILIEGRNRGTLFEGAAPLLVSELTPDDRVAVLTYGTGVSRKLDWGKAPDEIRQAIEESAKGVQLQTPRALNAIVETLKMFADSGEVGRKRAILIVGDEQDAASPMRLESVLANVLEKRVLVSVIVDPAPGKVMGKIIPKINVTPGNVGDPSVSQPQSRYGAQSVSLLAVASGGDVLAPAGVWFLEDMLKRLRARQLLSYCVAKNQAERMPLVDFTPAAKAKYAPALLIVPSLKLASKR